MRASGQLVGVGAIAVLAIAVAVVVERLKSDGIEGVQTVELAPTPAPAARERSEAPAIAPPTEEPPVVAEAQPAATSVAATDDAPDQRHAKKQKTAGRRGRVVDEATGEPVAHVEVKATTIDGAVVTALTDADGVFVTPSAMAWPVRAAVYEPSPPFVHEHGREVVRFETTPADTAPGVEPVIRASIGPTYRFAPTTEIDERCRRPRHARARVVARDGDGGETGASEWQLAFERDGSFFVRFPYPLGLEEGSANELQIVLASWPAEAVPVDDDPIRYTGSTTITSTVGIHPGVLPIEVDERLGLAIRVREADGTPIDDVQVSLLHLEANEPTSDQAWTGKSDREGRCTAFPLRAGRYRVVTRSREFVRTETTFDAWPRRQTIPDLILERIPVGGPIAGKLEITGGLADHFALVRVRSVGRYPYDDVEFIELEANTDAEDATSGTFRFDDLPACAFEVSMICVPDLPSEPRSFTVEPPATDLLFRLDGVDEGTFVGFETYDAQTGEPIDEVQALFDVGGRPLPTTKDCNFGEPEWKLARRGELSWWLEADGYRPAHGDERAFAPTGDPRIAVVRLEPGFGARFLFRDASPLFEVYFDDDVDDELAIYSSPPIAGVRVYADGELAAKSDEFGLATLSLSAPPTEIEIRAPGWRILESDSFRDGRVTGDRSPAVVWMLP